MKNSNPAQYHRNSKDWNAYLGKVATVVQSTTVCVSSPELESFLPYDYLIVKIDDENNLGETIEIMGVSGQQFRRGDSVRLVFKKIGIPEKSGIIPYGIKAELITDLEK